MNDRLDRVARARSWAEQASWVIRAGSSGYNAEEWLLLATNVAEADLIVREEQRTDPAFRLPELDNAVVGLREITSDFRSVEFLRASRAARRRNPELFTQRKRAD